MKPSFLASAAREALAFTPCWITFAVVFLGVLGFFTALALTVINCL